MRGYEMYGYAPGVHHFHIVAEAWSAAAAGHEGARMAADIYQSLPLHGSERLFASGGEYVSDAAACRLLDIVVKVYEAHSCALRYSPAECGLAAAHVSYQEGGGHVWLWNLWRDLMICMFGGHSGSDASFCKGSKNGILTIFLSGEILLNRCAKIV